MFCMVGQAQPMTKIDTAHENPILGVGFHPNGHMLATCECLGLVLVVLLLCGGAVVRQL
jgi:hypothetical protein